MADAEVSNQGVDRSDLDSFAAAIVAQLSSLDVVVDLGGEHGQQGEVPNDLLSGRRPLKALEQFLKNQSRRDDDLAPFEAGLEEYYFGGLGGRTSSQSQ